MRQPFAPMGALGRVTVADLKISQGRQMPTKEPSNAGAPAAAEVPRYSSATWWLLAASPVVLLLAHYIAVLPHEFDHSFMAWMWGIKSDPLRITWGHGSIGDILLLIGIDENVDYPSALAQGNTVAVAFTVFAGPATNGLFYLLTRFAVPLWRTSGRPVVAYLMFWFLFINLANLYDYVPIRVASGNGDVWEWIQATRMS
ncbi:zinc metalloprotease [Mycolicibacterium sphagni]|uniref:hypothetical protein n=1 Tax=Mycolicibacterium sphagni TaxID=1786 RepID=UPI0021F26DFA|nr:hypothetical protein [Mycolicibacterium sphagni]MCV7177962.1 hypothetical protein [Mycolicibacterium sphagni]